MPIYDVHPVYPHQAQMPYAREPWKSIYVWQRLLTTVFLVPLWSILYLLRIKAFRPRKNWALKQVIITRFYRRVYKVVEVAGVTWGTRDPKLECDSRDLRETRFEWVAPLRDELRTGVVVDPNVSFERVGTFVWPKVPKQKTRVGMGLAFPLVGVIDEIRIGAGKSDTEADAGKPEVIGIFMHGGGYTQMSAHEKAGTSRIPRRLVNNGTFTEIYAVEYRLLQHAPVPGAIQDAAAVYSHILIDRMGATPDAAGKYTFPTKATSPSPTSNSNSHDPKSNSPNSNAGSSMHTTDFAQQTESQRWRNVKIVLIGDSAGGNLVLGLARWIRDEGVLPPADGLLLLSPSCDPSHAFPLTPSSYIPRPHASADYLVDTPEPRALLQRTFLGHHPLETIHSPYISPASARVLRAYGHPFDLRPGGGKVDGAYLGAGAIAVAAESVIALAGPKGAARGEALASVGVAGISGRTGEGARLSTDNNDNAHASEGDGMSMSRRSIDSLPTAANSPMPTPRIPGTGSPRIAFDSSTPQLPQKRGQTELDVSARAMAQQAISNAHAQHLTPKPGSHSPNPNSRSHPAPNRPALQSTMTFLNPSPRDPGLRASLFGQFPRTFVSVGTAERLEREIKTLVGAMERDGVELTVEWAEDAVHDFLMLAWWDEKVREKTWDAIKSWVEGL